MPKTIEIAGINLVSLLINIIVALVSAYIVLLVRSIKREFNLRADNIQKNCERQTATCGERITDIKKDVDDLLVRARVLGSLEERLKSGAENFQKIENRLDWLEYKKK